MNRVWEFLKRIFSRIEEFEDMPTEEFADMAVEELRAFINTEEKFVEEEHALIDKLLSWDYIMLHLDESLPTNMVHLIHLNHEIAAKLIEIRKFIGKRRLKDLRIEKEEKHILAKLEKDVKHRDWKAIRRKAKLRIYIEYLLLLIGKKQKKVLRLEIRELKELHSKLKDLLGLTSTTMIMLAINEDIMEAIKRTDKTITMDEIKEIAKRSGDKLQVFDEAVTIQKHKEEYERLEEYYFLQIHKFAIAYERIFRHLWEKEKILYEKAQRISKRMK